MVGHGMAGNSAWQFGLGTACPSSPFLCMPLLLPSAFFMACLLLPPPPYFFLRYTILFLHCLPCLPARTTSSILAFCAFVLCLLWFHHTTHTRTSSLFSFVSSQHCLHSSLTPSLLPSYPTPTLPSLPSPTMPCLPSLHHTALCCFVVAISSLSLPLTYFCVLGIWF